MYYIIYKIVNQIDGKFYIGSHKTKNLNDNYMGSGKYLKRAQEKYGIENFTKEILFVFDTPDEMYRKEAELVNEEFLTAENTYNLKIGGFGGWDYINSNEETRKEKNRRARKTTDSILLQKYGTSNSSQISTVKEKLSIIAKTRYTNGFRLNGSFKGKKHNEQSKKMIGEKNKITQLGENNSQFGTMWINDKVTNKKIKKTSEIPNGWSRGRLKN